MLQSETLLNVMTYINDLQTHTMVDSVTVYFSTKKHRLNIYLEISVYHRDKLLRFRAQFIVNNPINKDHLKKFTQHVKKVLNNLRH